MPHPEGPHPEVDDLALVALGEVLDDASDAHIAGCAECTAQVESFRGTIDLAGLSDYGRDAPAPDAHVWDAISTELGFATDRAVPASGAADPPIVTAAPPPVVSAVPPPIVTAPPPPIVRAVPPPDGASAPTGPSPAATAPGPPASTAPRSAAPARRRARWVAPIAAAAVGIALGAGAVILVQNRETSVTVDATAPLTPVQGGPLPSSDGQLGTADLVTARDGQQVRVDASGLPAPASTAYEVWLFGDDGRMVSLGTLSDGTGSFTVPTGIDTTQYRTVDISDEPPDGNPAHSGVSMVRGTFA